MGNKKGEIANDAKLKKDDDIKDVIELLKEFHFVKRSTVDQSKNENYEVTKIYQENKKIDKNNIENYITICSSELESSPKLDVDFIDKQVEKEGMDALAYYIPIHKDPENWGIYIKEQGVYYLAEKIFKGTGQVSKFGRPYNLIDNIQQSFKVLYSHELFHFITELAATTLELATMNEQDKCNYYMNYLNQIYLKPNKPNEPMEEALANAFAYRIFMSSDKILKQNLTLFMGSQPDGYSAYSDFISHKNFKLGKRKIATIISAPKTATFTNDGYPPLELLFMDNLDKLKHMNIPLYIVHDIADCRYSLKMIQSISVESITVSKKFNKELEKIKLKKSDIYLKYIYSKQILTQDTSSKSLNFEKLKGCGKTFTFRVDKNYRVSLYQNEEGNWEFLRIGTHDDIYKNPPCSY